MGCDYDRDIEPLNVRAHEANLEIDVDVFKDSSIDVGIVKAFEVVHGVEAYQAEALLGIRPTCQCSSFLRKIPRLSTAHILPLVC